MNYIIGLGTGYKVIKWNMKLKKGRYGGKKAPTDGIELIRYVILNILVTMSVGFLAYL